MAGLGDGVSTFAIALAYLLSTLLAHDFVVAAYTPASTSATDALASSGLESLIAYAATLTPIGSCSMEDAVHRREWSDLGPSEKVEYTNAILCLMEKPSLYTTEEIPGSKSRYDDFVAIHMNQTLTIHGTANFLSWHRYFVYTFEKTLQDECGFRGTQPYWNWGKSAFDPANSPVFDGSPYSMSGNGVFEAHNCTNALPNGENCIPPGVGGGCVEKGPFKNMTVNLGPIAPTLAEPEDMASASLFAANPRCLKRDITAFASSRFSRDADTLALLTASGDVAALQEVMQGGDFAGGFYGVHAAGHFTFGGDPGGDLFASPGDPAFWLHHAMIDRVWWVWQNAGLPARWAEVAGPRSMASAERWGRVLGTGPGTGAGELPLPGNGTLDDVISLGRLAPAVTIRQVMSSTFGTPLCYIYV